MKTITYYYHKSSIWPDGDGFFPGSGVVTKILNYLRVTDKWRAYFPDCGGKFRPVVVTFLCVFPPFLAFKCKLAELQNWKAPFDAARCFPRRVDGWLGGVLQKRVLVPVRMPERPRKIRRQNARETWKDAA